MKKTKKADTPNLALYQERHPEDYALLMELKKDCGPKHNCTVTLDAKRLIVEMEKLADPEEVKIYKLCYHAHTSEELTTPFEVLDNKRRAMFRPFYEALQSILNTHKIDIALIENDGAISCVFGDGREDEIFQFTREGYDDCLNRIIDLIANPDDEPPCVTTDDRQHCDKHRCLKCRDVTCANNPHLIQCLWNALNEDERKAIAASLDPADRELLNNSLEAEDRIS